MKKISVRQRILKKQRWVRCGKMLNPDSEKTRIGWERALKWVLGVLKRGGVR